MAIGQSVGLWDGMVVGCCRFPWAMPKATLIMAVGQNCVLGVRCGSLGDVRG